MERFKIGERVKFRRYVCDIVDVNETGYTARLVGEGYVFHGVSEDFKPFITELKNRKSYENFRLRAQLAKK